MKIALFGLAGIKTGKHNLKDPRFDEADKLVEADKKTHAQVDVVGEDQLIDAEAILVSVEGRADMILKDLEFVETRLGREPQEAERQALEKIKALLEQEKFVFNSGLAPADLEAVAAHNFFTAKPIVVAEPADLENPDALLLRAFREGGYICFLTVGGKENRACRSGRAPRPGKPAAPFTRTSRRVSSARKSSATRISSRRAAKRRPSAPTKCGWRPSPTSCRTTT